MPWTCLCTAMNYDTAEECIRCGRPQKPRSHNTTGVKLAAVAGCLFIGGVVGLSLGVVGNNTNAETAQAGRVTDEKPGFDESFDASFKNSCRSGAMRSGRISRAVADNFCECALESFHKNHSMPQAVANCKKYVSR